MIISYATLQRAIIYSALKVILMASEFMKLLGCMS